jgi:hypothetical protein
MTMRAAVAFCAVLAAGCSSVSGTYPRDGAIIPEAAVQITRDHSLTAEELIVVAGVSYLAYKLIDPFAPNWKISEAKLGNDQYALSMRMKHLYTGGAGEARQVFVRRAEQLVRELGYAGYEIVRYSESIDSGLVPRRTGEGVIMLVRGTN